MKVFATIILTLCLLFTLYHQVNSACSCSACKCNGDSQCPRPIPQYQTIVKNLTCPAGSHFYALSLAIDSPAQNVSFVYDTYSESNYINYVNKKSASSVYSSFVPVACSALPATASNISPYSKLFMVIGCAEEGGCLARYSITQQCAADYYFTVTSSKSSLKSDEEFSIDVSFAVTNYSMSVSLSTGGIDGSSVSLKGVTTRQMTGGKVSFSGLSMSSSVSGEVLIKVSGQYLETSVIGFSDTIAITGNGGRTNVGTISHGFTWTILAVLFISYLLF